METVGLGDTIDSMLKELCPCVPYGRLTYKGQLWPHIGYLMFLGQLTSVSEYDHGVLCLPPGDRITTHLSCEVTY